MVQIRSIGPDRQLLALLKVLLAVAQFKGHWILICDIWR